MVPDDNVQVHFGAGEAAMNVTNLSLADFANLKNSLIGQSGEGPFAIPPVPATVSYSVLWSGVTSRLSNAPNTPPDQFAGQYVMNTATIAWSASTASGFTFASDSNPTTSRFALIGHEQNGVFLGS